MGFPTIFGVVSYRIRILLYREVSCVYPEGYTYLECILVYLKCILNALFISKRIHVQNHGEDTRISRCVSRPAPGWRRQNEAVGNTGALAILTRAVNL